jgi:ABC-type lipoprotein release transport system permease subunit
MLSFRLGWRNLWRNGKRTAITWIAISLNTAVMILSYALMDGIMDQVLSNATNQVAGEVQVHAKGYLAERSVYLTLPDPQAIMRRAGALSIPAAARSYGYGLLSHGSKSAGAQFWGARPDEELAAFDLGRNIAEGSYLPTTPRPQAHDGSAARPMVLGSKLARSLNVAPGDELVAVVQAMDGSLGSDLFTVSGVLKLAGDNIDRGAAIVLADDFRELFVSGDAVHEIAFNSRGRVAPEDIVRSLAAATADLDVRTWRKILPALSDMVGLFDASILIFALIFGLAAASGVLNTMLMSTFERIRELGVQKALGATPLRILGDVAAEAFLLAWLGTVAGVVLALPASFYLHSHGLDLSRFFSGFTAMGVAYDPVWYAKLGLHVFIEPVLVMWVVCLVASLWPAVKAARIEPVQAMTHV